MQITPEETRLLKRIIERSECEDAITQGYSICPNIPQACEYPNVLTLARILTNTTYLMLEHHAEKTKFVHFTTEDGVKGIISNSEIKASTFENKEDVDYEGVHCFRIDAMSRPFATSTINFAIVFDFEGDYMSCVRQEDVNSNIGYCVIPSSIKVTNLEILDLGGFQKKYSKLDFSQVLKHHGIPSVYKNELEQKSLHIGMCDALCSIYEMAIQ